MNKFLGILFFYVLAFENRSGQFDITFYTRCQYLNEKSKRYLGLPISESQWELLKIYLKNTPSPGGDKILSDSDIFLLIDAFDKVFHLENIQYELRIYVPYEDEMRTIDQCFDKLEEYIEIIGSSNGVSVTLGSWLEKSTFNRILIEREINLTELI